MSDETTGSTVPRRQLGRELRRLREAAGITVEAAAEMLEWSRPKLWRIEKGAVALRSLDVEAMCRSYGADGEITTALMGLAKDTKAKGWWQSYNDVIPAWFDVYLGLEAAADSICEYAPELVPGLLQTEAYARALFALPGGPTDGSEINRRVALRLGRHQLLTRRYPAPLKVTFILNEAVLRRPVGDHQVMAAQLAHIVQASELSTVDVRVLPFDAGAHSAAVAGWFTTIEFHNPNEPDVVYCEGLTGALYLDKTVEIDQYRIVLKDLMDKSLSETETRDLIASMAKEYFHG